MKIDFTKPFSYWVELIREFLETVEKFFSDLGIVLFEPKEEPEA